MDARLNTPRAKFVRNKLLIRGARNLREFGYSTANVGNVTTDYVFAQFFKAMLKEAKGLADAVTDLVIDDLIKQCDAAKLKETGDGS
jgi:hypothetical protein